MNLLSKFVSEGDQIEISPVDKKKTKKDGEKGTEGAENKFYVSKLFDIISDDSMEILMPMEKNKLILLPIDGDYNLIIYSSGGLFQCFVRVVDRYRSNNVYVLMVNLTSNLRKFQRREYYRFSCALEMCARNLEEEEIQALEEKAPYILQPNLPIKRSVIVDISGGGLRFVSDQAYEIGSLIFCSYTLIKGDKQKLYELVGKVLAVKQLEGRKAFEHRVQYYNIDENVREEIIKFIFEEERKERQM